MSEPILSKRGNGPLFLIEKCGIPRQNHNFDLTSLWRGKKYRTKQIEVYAVEETGDFIVITMVVKYF